MIHGFAGGTYDEENLANYLELNRQYDVFQFTLPGHDGEYKGKITYDLWIEAASSKVKFLIDVTPFPIVMLVSPVQPLKAEAPMDFTLSPTVTAVKS